MVVARGLGRRRTTTIRSSTTTSSCCLVQPTNLAYLVLFLFALLFVHHLSDVEDDVGYFYSGFDSSSSGSLFLRRSDDPWTSLLRSSATNKFSISCDSVRHKLASHEWSDPNDGKLFARSVITQPSFQISVHNETYDPVRWKYIYETGTYYEDLVQSRFDTILSQAENTKTSTLVVDVGANIGYYTLLSLAYDVPVLSFEINPANLVRLCESLQLNSDQNFEARNLIFQKGVSNQDGVELQVIVPKNPGQAFMKEMEYNNKNQDKSGVVNAKEISAHHAITTTITLDSLAHELGWLENAATTSSTSTDWEIIILKLDVEGKEPQIIEGARQLLESGRVENVLTEFRRMSRPTIQEAIQTLHDTGYTIVDDSSSSKQNNKNYTPMTRKASEAYLQRLAAQSKGSGKNFDLWFKRAPTT